MTSRALEVARSRLSPAERRVLARAGGAGDVAWRAVAEACGPARIEIAAEPPFAAVPGEVPARGEAARSSAEGDSVRLVHAEFRARLDPAAGRAVLWRTTAEPYPLEITLRALLCALLPRAGGLPLHAAGVVRAHRGLVFFGPSGAGKSTLAASAPDGVVSDELVAVLPRPWRLVASGFWGTGERDAPAAGEAPLAALCALEKATAFDLPPLAPPAAARRLLDCVTVPALAGVWQPTMTALGALLAEVPAYRLRWSKDEPPWDRLDAALALNSGAIRTASGRR